MITQLSSDPSKYLQPSCNYMMSMLVKSNNSINVDIPARYKALWIKNKLDGTEDHLVSERINYSCRPKTYAFQGKSDEEPEPQELEGPA